MPSMMHLQNARFSIPCAPVVNDGWEIPEDTGIEMRNSMNIIYRWLIIPVVKDG
jgi:hypothetical protein